MASKNSVVAMSCLYYFYTLRVKYFVALYRCFSQVLKHSLHQETIHVSYIKTNR